MSKWSRLSKGRPNSVNHNPNLCRNLTCLALGRLRIGCSTEGLQYTPLQAVTRSHLSIWLCTTASNMRPRDACSPNQPSPRPSTGLRTADVGSRGRAASGKLSASSHTKKGFILSSPGVYCRSSAVESYDKGEERRLLSKAPS